MAAVLGPPVAAVCIELVRYDPRGRKGAVKDKPSVAELLVPSDARAQSLYELLSRSQTQIGLRRCSLTRRTFNRGLLRSRQQC